MGLAKDSEWKAQFSDTHPWVPTIVHFIDIFVAKTQFYQFWKPMFLWAQEYPDMKDWLNQHKDQLSTKELWGEDAKHTLTFSDLKQWLEVKDREADIKQHDGKGERKAPQSPPKLKKKKQDERDRAVVQRKHKKSKILRQSDGESE